MKKFQCDVCQLDVGEYDLRELTYIYKTEEIKHICKGCNDKIIEALGQVERAFAPIRESWIKQIIKKMIKQ